MRLFIWGKNKNVIKINKNIYGRSLRTSFTRAWNTAGALVSPKGMARYS